LEFENSSLKFNAEYAEEISEHRIVEFNEEFDDVRRGKPPARARYATRAQYAKIAEPLDPDEIVDFGLYRPGIPAPELVPLSKRHAAALLGDQSVDGTSRRRTIHRAVTIVTTSMTGVSIGSDILAPTRGTTHSVRIVPRTKPTPNTSPK